MQTFFISRRVFLFAASCLYIVSFFLPAVTIQLFKPTVLSGIWATLCGWMFWPANLIALSIATSALQFPEDVRNSRFRTLNLVVTILLVTSTLGAASVPFFGEILELHVGYWCWLGSLSLMSTVFILTSPPDQVGEVEDLHRALDTPESPEIDRPPEENAL